MQVAQKRKTGPKPGNPHAGQFQKGADSRRMTPETVRLKELTRNFTEEAVTTIRDIMNDPEAAQRDRLAAAAHILDRGWGKPISGHVVVATEEPKDVKQLSTAQIIANLSEFSATLGAVPAESEALEAQYTEVSGD